MVGGGWMGFHFAGFALTPSDFNQDWDWYHNEFIELANYKSIRGGLRRRCCVLKRPVTLLPKIAAGFRSSPNEWYSWEKDLTKNPDIKILLSIDSTSFPLGTGQNCTRSGIAATTLLPGRIRNIK